MLNNLKVYITTLIKIQFCYFLDSSGKIQENAWLSNATKLHTLRGIGKMPKSVPKLTHSKRTVLSTIEIPHPGTSYNPTFEDHQELLHSVVERESKLMKEEAHIHRVTRGMFSKVTPSENEVRHIYAHL